MESPVSRLLEDLLALELELADAERDHRHAIAETICLKGQQLSVYRGMQFRVHMNAVRLGLWTHSSPFPWVFHESLR